MLNDECARGIWQPAEYSYNKRRDYGSSTPTKSIDVRSHPSPRLWTARQDASLPRNCIGLGIVLWHLCPKYMNINHHKSRIFNTTIIIQKSTAPAIQITCRL
ncbi:uncharacterized protein LOC143031994 isoform X1 [Oratosquilla oratoria]|uniref:uncharacterized protein LOC143031994 isoform X1 n=1 Tax=Oratosquilla oratoria TaxID=337810 RepID=UPI003F765205